MPTRGYYNVDHSRAKSQRKAGTFLCGEVAARYQPRYVLEVSFVLYVLLPVFIVVV